MIWPTALARRPRAVDAMQQVAAALAKPAACKSPRARAAVAEVRELQQRWSLTDEEMSGVDIDAVHFRPRRGNVASS